MAGDGHDEGLRLDLRVERPGSATARTAKKMMYASAIGHPRLTGTITGCGWADGLVAPAPRGVKDGKEEHWQVRAGARPRIAMGRNW